jgi:mono/diheme cytochrome c family protein
VAAGLWGESQAPYLCFKVGEHLRRSLPDDGPAVQGLVNAYFAAAAAICIACHSFELPRIIYS